MIKSSETSTLTLPSLAGVDIVSSNNHLSPTSHLVQAKFLGLYHRHFHPASPSDRLIFWYWVAFHAVLTTVAYIITQFNPTPPSLAPTSSTANHNLDPLVTPTAHAFSQVWERWDAYLLRSIAQHGYLPSSQVDPELKHQIAFFPGYPIVLAGTHLILRSYLLSEFFVSFVAGYIALCLLCRITNHFYYGSYKSPTNPGISSALALLLAPASIFLALGYTESLFLAFALATWWQLAAPMSELDLDRYLKASVWAGLAAFTRVNGLFLIAGIIVLALFQDRRGSRLLHATQVAITASMPPLAYEVYMYYTTSPHDSLAWIHAQQQGWGRHFVSPETSFLNTYRWAFEHQVSSFYSPEYQLEIVAAIVAALLCIWLAWQQQWGMLTYCALTTLSLTTCTNYMAIPRALLLLWPLWGIVGDYTSRRPRLWLVYIPSSGVVALLLAANYLSGGWSG